MKKMMKKLCSVAILLAMVLTMMPVVAFAADAATPDYSWYGDGSATTFTLNDVNDLIGFNNLMAGADGKTATTFEGKTVLLGKDITYNDVTDYANWATTAPANQWTAAGVVFLGTFDGQGHTITGFYMAATNHGQAMFSALGGTVRNFSLVKAYVNTAGKQRIGSVVGEGIANTSMVIENVASDATFSSASLAQQVGGIIGDTMNCSGTVTISGCIFSGTVYGKNDVAGILGYGRAGEIEIVNCVNTGTINASHSGSGNNVPYSGAIIGRLKTNATISNCVNDGTLNISCSSSNRARSGGLVGYLVGQTTKSLNISGCIVGGSINKTGTKALNDVGGIVGCIGNSDWSVTIDSCLVTCEINGGTTSLAAHYGAIVGYSMNNGTTTISNCLIKNNSSSVRNNFSAILGATQTLSTEPDSTTNKADGSTNISNVIFAKALAENVYIKNPIVNADTTKNPDTITFSNVYYDASVVDADRAESVIPTATGISSKTTEQLKSVPTGWTKWIVQDNTYPIPAAIVQANCVELIGYQNYTTAQNGKTSYRFIAVVDELANLGVAGAMDYAGFKVSITVGNNTKTDTVWCNNAYTSLIGGETTYRADQYGGEYFFFFTLTNVPANTTFEITLTPFVGTSSEAADLYEGVAKTLTLTTPAASGSAS